MINKDNFKCPRTILYMKVSIEIQNPLPVSLGCQSGFSGQFFGLLNSKKNTDQQSSIMH